MGRVAASLQFSQSKAFGHVLLGKRKTECGETETCSQEVVGGEAPRTLQPSLASA